MPRLFVALRPPSAIRQRLLAMMGGVPGARWQDDDQLHLTLRFVGEVTRATAEDIAAALGAIHAPTPELMLAGVGRFDKRGRTDTLWAGITPQADLARLHRKVDQACMRAGLDPERRAYLPHVTLARLPRTAGAGIEIDRWCADHAALASVAFILPHLVLYQSSLGHGGAVYEAVARWPLGEGTATPA